MSKFDVGVKVRATTWAAPSTGTISRVSPTGTYTVMLDCAAYPKHPAWESGGEFFIYQGEIDLAPLESSKIVITSDGTNTLARLYEGKKVIKTAEAKCAPGDTYDFNTGANLAYDRLMRPEVFAEPVEKPTETPVEKPQEVIKLYCVKDNESGIFLTSGKIYELIPGGRIRFDAATFRSRECADFKDFSRQNPGLAACLVPLVKRPAKVGEWVYIQNAWRLRTENYKDGEIHRVDSVAENCVLLDCGGCWCNRNEYLVLDGYHPEPEKPEPRDCATCANWRKA